MTKSEHILKELKELESGLGDIQHPDYQVPAGYFDGFSAEMIRRVKVLESTDAREELENLSPLLSALPKQTPYTVPEGYFSEMSKNIGRQAVPVSDHISLDEVISPVLASLKDKATYQVPAGYFENLGENVLEKVNTPEAKLIPITGRKWFRYAAAASVIAFVAILALLIPRQNKSEADNTSYAWVKNNLKKVSTDDISEFVELATVEPADVVKTDTRDEISSLLRDVSDKEIQDFLNETQLTEFSGDEELILN